ncbi:MAG: DUF86 domain-containing protein [Deltaproteobacteria bacterium]|nr:MAG: DUF86 domain-containing protein [Deltaproteobacteria bacterium]
MKDDRLYLTHILECIERIQDFVKEGEQVFLADIKTQDAVLRNLHTLSESTQRISEKTQAQHPDVEWRSISGFRNVLVHDYLGVDLSQIWHIINTDLKTLHDQIKKIFTDLQR